MVFGVAYWDADDGCVAGVVGSDERGGGGPRTAVMRF